MSVHCGFPFGRTSLTVSHGKRTVVMLSMPPFEASKQTSKKLSPSPTVPVGVLPKSARPRTGAVTGLFAESSNSKGSVWFGDTWFTPSMVAPPFRTIRIRWVTAAPYRCAQWFGYIFLCKGFHQPSPSVVKFCSCAYQHTRINRKSVRRSLT